MQRNMLTLIAIFQIKIHVVNLNMVTRRKHKAGNCHSPAICWSIYKSYTPQFIIQIFYISQFFKLLHI